MKYKTILLVCVCFIAAFSLCAASNSDAETESKRLAQQAMANPDYRVLPGDIYQLGYTIGQNAVSYQIVVDSSGIIRVSNLGSVNTNGKTFLAVKKQVETLVSQNYPLSVVQFVLTAPSTFTVTVKGEVNKTTEVKAWGLMRASQAITGLLTDFASNRYLSITGRSGKTIDYDLFQAIRFGDLTQDPYLSPGDVISIPRVKRRVTLSGAVERPGTYELAETETLAQLIDVYGSGYTAGANRTQVKITRTTNTEDGSTKFDSFFVALSGEPDGNEQLQHLDKVYIDTQKTLRPFVYLDMPLDAETRAGLLADNQTGNIRGGLSNQTTASAINKDSEGKIVATTIPIPFNEGDDLISIVRERLPIFTKPWIDVTGAYIFRQGKQIPINLSPLLFDQSYHEIIPIEAEDRLVVPEIKQTVTVDGAVTNPGSYPYTPGRKADFYIALAGGFDYQRNTGGAVVIRDVYGKKLTKDDILGPNTIITAKSNAFMYNFNMYVPLITVTATILTIITSIITLTKR
ncbi:polysaccharide export protein [Treponema sp. OMZ 305]|uniref:SLBB domain-containing protein n=1 Tax=unclassified Treponema TaxID=2638727 RepID=UPI0020A4BB99|nr:SLBB domain-containing protein [Treponema sp. OMZ 305]UTC58643.1 polysaccharide export protein [Treponema sp. OMZ 305]